jgi:Arc/MetJ-type ribon-helix-helix transcriptional regulator
MPAVAKLNVKLIGEAVKLGGFKSKQEAVNSALAEFVQRRNRLRLLDLEGQVDFHADWDHKKLRSR